MPATAETTKPVEKAAVAITFGQPVPAVMLGRITGKA